MKPHVGIVDPFIVQTSPWGASRDISAGSKVYVLLFPNTITSLKHQWSHPAFPETEENKTWFDEHAQWIENFAVGAGLSYRIVMDGASNWLETIADSKYGAYGDRVCFGSLLIGKSVPDEFWDHYDKVMDMETPQEFRGNFFTCSC